MMNECRAVNIAATTAGTIHHRFQIIRTAHPARLLELYTTDSIVSLGLVVRLAMRGASHSVPNVEVSTKFWELHTYGSLERV